MSPAAVLDRALVGVHEWFTVPSVLSPRAGAWEGAHDLLALPLALRGPVQRWRAEVDGAPVTVTCVGRPKRFRRLLRTWLGDPAPLEAAGAPTAAALHAPAELRALGGDLLLAAIHPWAAARFRRDGWTIAPEAVRWRAPLDAVPPAQPTESLRSDLRKLARQGWTYDEGCGEADWTEFFDTMVIPGSRSRFGAETWLPGATLRAALRREGRLYFVCRGGERLAGFVLLARGEVAWSPVLGVREGRPELQRDGIVTAIYDHIVRRSRERGHRVLDIGRTSPFLGDGVQRVKRKWGFAPRRDRLAQVISVWAAPDCAPLAAALARAPLLSLAADGTLAAWPAGGPPRPAA